MKKVYCSGCKFHHSDVGEYCSDTCLARPQEYPSAIYHIISYPTCDESNKKNDCTLREPGRWERFRNWYKRLALYEFLDYDPIIHG